MSDPRMIEAIVLRTGESETKKNGLVRTVSFMLPNDGDNPFKGRIGDRIGLVCINLGETDHETPVGVGASTGQGGDTGGESSQSVSRAPPALIEGWTTTLSGDPPKPDRRPWSVLTPTQQAAIRCGDPDFWDFLSGDDFLVMNALEAAQYVRQYCKVETRAELTTNPEAAEMWRRLDNHFLLRPKKEGHA
jgi:hypothetical protein